MMNLWNYMMNPLDQFVVRPVWGNFKLGINTFTLDTLLCAGVTFWLFYLLLVSNKNLSHLYTFAIGPALKTLSYGGVVGSKRYRPLYVFVFVLITMSNVMGMIPFSLTSTSFAVMTFFAGITMFAGINIIALASYNWKFVNLFLPSGAPLLIAPFLIIIETISYFARVMSLSIRLFANLLAGHALMKIIGTFVWSTPLIAAGLVNSLRPVASSRGGLAESTQVFTTELANFWSLAVNDANELISKANWWLFQNGIDMQIGALDALNTVVATIATYAITFTAVSSVIFVFAHYFADELTKTINTVFPSVVKFPVVNQLLNVCYGIRAWLLSVIASTKAVSFDTKRQVGVLGLVMFGLSAFKYSLAGLLNHGFTWVSRGNSIDTRVSVKDIWGWNKYVAPVFSTAFWWVVLTIVLTYKCVQLVNFISFTHMANVTFGWADIFSSNLWMFGIFGSGIIMATVLSVLMLGDVVWAVFNKTTPTFGNKVYSLFSGKVMAWCDTLAAIITGLFAGWLQVSIYYMLFDVFYVSQLMPDSLVYAALVRLSHWALPYIIVFGLLAYVATLVADLITKSMDATETRNYMKWLWNVGPVVVLGLILAEVLYWSLIFDILGGAWFEARCVANLIANTTVATSSLATDLWNAWNSFQGTNMLSYIRTWDNLWYVLSVHGVNPMITVLGSIGSIVYVFMTFVGNSIGTILTFIIVELVYNSILAGLSSLVGLLALVFVPLITPLAWTFLLAITFLEMVIAFLQAYVFITLSSMYLNDVIKLH